MFRAISDSDQSSRFHLDKLTWCTSTARHTGESLFSILVFEDVCDVYCYEAFESLIDSYLMLLKT